MGNLSYTVELADNGIIVTDNNLSAKTVCQQKDNEAIENCYRRGLSESIAFDLAVILEGGMADVKPRDKYNIKIEIR